jgi:drug/metabolite transporter (DMT)-like permease
MKEKAANTLIACLTLITASSFLAGKYVLAEVDPIQLVFLRFLIATLSLLPFAATRFRSIKCIEIVGGLLSGVFLAIGMIGLTIGLHATDPGRASFLISTDFIFIAILDVIVLKGALRLTSVVGVFVGLLGLYFLVFEPISVTDILNTSLFAASTGDIAIIVGAVFFALYTVANTYYSPYTDAVIVGFVQVFIVALIANLLAWLQGSQLSISHLYNFSTKTWYVLLYLSVVTTAFRFYAQSFLQRYTTATHTGFIFLLEPVIATFLGVWILNEPLTAIKLLGAGLIIVATTIVQLKIFDVKSTL